MEPIFAVSPLALSPLVPDHDRGPTVENITVCHEIFEDTTGVLDRLLGCLMPNTRLSTLVQSFRTILKSIPSHPYQDAALPTYLALTEVVAQCHSTLKVFLDRESQPHLRSSTCRAGYGRRAGVMIAELEGYVVSIFLLSQLHQG